MSRLVIGPPGWPGVPLSERTGELAPDYVVVGHVTIDVLPDGGTTPGGTAAYSALLASQMGKRVGLISRHASDLDLEAYLPGVQVLRLASTATTRFRNVYLDGVRRQFVIDRAEPIGVESLPEEWKEAPIVHLGPIVQEVDQRFIEAFPRSLLGVSPQGWMREWDDAGRVGIRPWRPSRRTLQQIDVLVVGETEISPYPDLLREYASGVKVVALTQGSKGATLYYEGQSVHIPPWRAKEVDPTGAGDVFAAAFLISYGETDDPLRAAKFASCAAALSVERVGLAGVPTAQQILRRLEQVAS